MLFIINFIQNISPFLIASVDNIRLDLHNSSYSTQPHSIIANY